MLKISHAVVPASLSPINVADQGKNLRAVRQETPRRVQVLPGFGVITISVIGDEALCEMRFAQLRIELERAADARFRQFKSGRSVIKIEPIEIIMRNRGPAVGERKFAIALDRFVEQADSAKQGLFAVRRIVERDDHLFRLQKQIERFQVVRRSEGDSRLFRRGNRCLEAVGDFLRHVTLDLKNIGQLAIIMLGPNLAVTARID